MLLPQIYSVLLLRFNPAFKASVYFCIKFNHTRRTTWKFLLVRIQIQDSLVF